MFNAGLRLELRLRLHQNLSALGALGFLAVALTAVGLTLGQYPERLRSAGPAVGWAMTVLALIYANADWWMDQVRSGLNQRLRSGAPDFAGFIFGRLIGAWLASLPWLLAAGWLISLFYSQPVTVLLALRAGLLIASPALVALSAFAAALRVLMGQVGVLLGAAALPLALPFVVVGVGLTDTLSLAALGLSLGLSLLQTVVFAWTTRWVLSLV